MALGVEFFEQDLTEIQIEPVGTEGIVFGYFPQGPIEPTLVTKLEQFNFLYGTSSSYAAIAARNFLRNSERLTVQRVLGLQNTNYPQAYPGWIIGIPTSDSSLAGGTSPNFNGTLAHIIVNFYATGTGGSAFDPVNNYYSASTNYNAGGSFNPDTGIAILATIALYDDGLTFEFDGATLGGTGKYSGGAAQPAVAPAVNLSATPADRDSIGVESVISGSQIADATWAVTIPNSPSNAANTVAKKISFNPSSDLYIGKTLNNDLKRIGDYGYAVVAKYDWVYSALKNFLPNSASSSVYISINQIGPYASSHFASRDFSGYANQAVTPAIQSQLFGGVHTDAGVSNPGGTTYRLFRFRAKQYGACSNGMIVDITNIRKSSEPGYEYGLFDVVVKDKYGKALETWTNLTLDPEDGNFISKVIGDRYSTFDSSTGQLVQVGKYTGNSLFLVVTMIDDATGRNLENAPGEYCPKAAVPWGFEGYTFWGNMQTNATGDVTSVSQPADTKAVLASGSGDTRGNYIGGLSSTPLVSRQYINNGWTPSRSWGVRTTKYGSDGGETDSKINNLTDETLFDKWQYVGVNASVVLPDYCGWAHPTYFISSSTGSAKFPSFFSLHHVSGTTFTLTGTSQVANTDLRNLVYNTNYSRPPLLNFEALQGTQAAQFQLVLAGGHDGWLPGLYEGTTDPTYLIGAATSSPYFSGTFQIGKQSSRLPTNNIHVASLMTALKILETTNDTAAVATMPGVRNDVVVQRLLDVAAAKGDMWAMVDIGSYGDSAETVLVSRKQTLNYDTSYGSLYSRWVRVSLEKGKSAWVPPTVVMAGVVSQSDRLAFPWYAPAGTSRGALKEFDVTAVDRTLTAKEVKDLNTAQVNVLIKNKGAFVAWGNETTRQKITALNQISIRRMVIEAKRVIGNAVQQLVFEPNNASTWTRFKNIVNPQLDLIKRNNGIEEFLVVADDTTTTLLKQKQGIMVGKIVVRPTYSIKSIEIPFTITDTAVATFDESAT